MGMIKRILVETSNKLLSKMGVHHSSAQRMVVNPTVPSALATVQAKKMRARRTAKRTRSQRDNTQDAAVISALTANLPPVQFHHVHGPNAELSPSKMVARRSQSFCHALVFSNRVILPNERVYIKVLEISKGWSGTIRFGFTAVDPATLSCQMPKHACPDMTNTGTTWARALADHVVRRNSVIHFSYNSDGYIHYGINNQDCGIFYANVNTSQNLWFIVDIYGLTAAVELIDPRMCATGVLEPNSDEENNVNHITLGSRATLAKLETNQRTRRKRSRKISQHTQLPVLPQWTSPGSWTLNNQTSLLHRESLPNLSSLELPQTQQNIYSPMPTAQQSKIVPQPISSHDYYQILSTSRQQLEPEEERTPVARQRASNELNQSISTNATTSSTSIAVQDELCRRMENVQVRNPDYQNPFRLGYSSPDYLEYIKALERSGIDMRDYQQQQQREAATYGWIARAEPVSSHISSRVIPAKPRTSASSKSKSTRTRNSSSSAAPSTGNNSTSTSSTSNKGRDNNNAPAGRDCPICFERPINCVLYQCGHMCTCYECGVKQWRTQSRTCPICRTVIKDVIKTYMS